MTGIITAMLLIIYFAYSNTESKTSAHDSTCISKWHWHCDLQFGSCFSGEHHLPNMAAAEHLPWVLNVVSAPIFVKHNVLASPPQE